MEMCYFLAGQFKGKDGELERVHASFPKRLVTRHNQGIGEGGQQPETIIQAGPQQSASQPECTWRGVGYELKF